ncbi:MAG: ABC transporter ATP-binding protein [Cycloclasticus sp.]|nr:ABC transporter ATP-binding protein [Cycloclasticus sp.]
MNQAPLLSVQGLSTHFKHASGKLMAVDGISFDIAKGETFALVGESGCGKSVAALSVLRLLPSNAKISTGQVYFRGEDLLQMPEKAMRGQRGTRISMIFQDPMTSLNPVMSIGEQIAEAVILRGQQLGKKALREKVVGLIKQVGIPDAEHQYASFPHQLSGGMRQRVMIAIALANEPDLLIADEPTTALDVTIQAQILQLLKELQQQTGMSLWIITHDLGIVADMADRVAVMYAGQLLEIAPKNDFFKHAAHPYSHSLFNALPSMDRREQPLISLPGRVPPLGTDFIGCRFADRCMHRQAICNDTAVINLQTLSAEHKVRCARLDEQLSPTPVEQVVTDAIPLEVSEHAALEVKNVSVHFPIKKGLLKRTVAYVKAVNEVSFTLPAGTTLALVGESGCGKTTLAKGLLKLLPLSSGEVNYQGQDLAPLSEKAFRPYRDKLQIIFQDPFSSMNPRMLVGDILEEGVLALKPRTTKLELELICTGLLEKVGLDPAVRSRYPHEFSGGQRQRLCIARALAVNPSILVCDEPTSALDVSVQAQVLNLLKQLQKEQGLSYLFISHDLSVVSYLADSVAVMYLGRVVEIGPVQAVLNNPAHPYTQALIDAIPQWDEARQKKLIKLPDDMPSASTLPTGCHFHSRCADVMPECSQQQPPEINLSRDHKVSCLKYS